LAFALLPLALWLFDRAIASGRVSSAFAAGAAMALGVYSGGTYPVAHAALAFAILALARTYTARTVRPLLTLATAGIAGLALGAPKLWPIALSFGRLGRPVDSEAYGPAQLLAALTHRAIAVYDDAALTPLWRRWWESGIFIGWGGVLLLIVGAFFARGRESRIWSAIGWCFAILSAGSFHAFAPWTLLHRLPIFWSMHVPIRFFHVALLGFSVAACRTLEGVLAGSGRWLRIVALIAVGAIGVDLAYASSPLWEPVFKLRSSAQPTAGAFRHVPESHFPYIQPLVENEELESAYEWPLAGSKPLGSMYLSMLENEGVVACYGIPAGPRTMVDATSTARLVGLTGEGGVDVVSWSPSRVVVDVHGAQPGAHLVYNMNYDNGWRANGQPAIAREGLVAARIERADERVVFDFAPPGLWPGLLACLAAIAVWIATRKKTLSLIPF
jgi:hypothetical protein